MAGVAWQLVIREGTLLTVSSYARTPVHSPSRSGPTSPWLCATWSSELPVATQSGDADPVIEAALHMQQLSHPLRDSLFRDDGTIEPGACRRQDHSKYEPLAQRQRAEDVCGDEPSAHDHQW